MIHLCIQIQYSAHFRPTHTRAHCVVRSVNTSINVVADEFSFYVNINYNQFFFFLFFGLSRCRKHSTRVNCRMEIGGCGLSFIHAINFLFRVIRKYNFICARLNKPKLKLKNERIPFGWLDKGKGGREWRRGGPMKNVALKGIGCSFVFCECC